MKDQELEKRLNNAESFLHEIGKLADEMKGKFEFSSEVSNVDKLKKLARDARTEVEDAKSKYL